MAQLTSLPVELLQKIFDFVVWQDSYSLAYICSVSRYWRIAAIHHPILWTYAMRWTELRISGEEGSAALEIQNRKLQICIARSGSLPLTVSVWFSVEDWTERRESVLAAVPIVTNECHRWQTVQLTLPVEALEPVLSPIRGKLPCLEKLDFSIPREQEQRRRIRFDFFAVAPSLHDVRVDMRDLGHLTVELNIVLPWSQLTSFDGCVPRCSVYRDLIGISRPNLMNMRYRCLSHTTLPAGLSTAVFPNLTKFYFAEGMDAMTDDFASPLDSLVLPSLAHLEIVNSNARSETFTPKLLSLVQRSHCPLQVLDVSTSVPPNSPTFIRILSLCPSLHELSIRNISAEYILQLVLDPASQPILPQLRQLTIYFSTAQDSNGEPEPAELDVPALMCMVQSRTLALVDGKLDTFETATGHRFVPLKRVDLHRFGSVKVFHSALTRWECESEELQALRQRFGSPSPSTANALPFRLAGRVGEALNVIECCSELTLQEFEEMSEDVDWALGELECLDFENINTSIVTRWGIVFGLTCVNNWTAECTLEPDKVDPEDIDRLHSRANDLLEQWRPFLIRDTRAFPFLWMYSHGYARFSYLAAFPDDEEHLWSEIIDYQ